MTLSDSKIFQRHGAALGLFATAELLGKLNVINCHFTLSSNHKY